MKTLLEAIYNFSKDNINIMFDMNGECIIVHMIMQKGKIKYRKSFEFNKNELSELFIIDVFNYLYESLKSNENNPNKTT